MRQTILILLAAASIASAQNAVSWVSSTGSDAAACTRSAPCRTFQVAHDHTNVGGTVHAADAADFSPVTITKTITIDGSGKGAVISGLAANSGFAISLTPPLFGPTTITLKNLTLFSNSTAANSLGIFGGLGASTQVTINIEDVAVIAPIGANVMGISIGGSTAAPQLSLRNVRIIGGTKGVVMTNATADLDRVLITGTSNTGIIVSDSSVTMRDSVITRNTGTGLDLFSSLVAGAVLMERSEVSFNNLGLLTETSGQNDTIRLSNSVITGNGTGLSSTGGPIISFRTNMIAGNTADGTPALSTSLK